MKWASSNWLKEPIGTWKSARFRFGIEAQRKHARLVVRPHQRLSGGLPHSRRLLRELAPVRAHNAIYPSTLAAKILQNVYQDEDINLFKFPVPFWHKRDGGRYIGTGHVVITRDPDDGWVNVDCYRVMVHDHNTLGMNISPGKHGRIHRQKYFDSGKPCPVVACFVVDPLLHMIATRPEPYGKCEFDAAGGIKGVPIEVGEGEYTVCPFQRMRRSPSRPRCCRTRERKKDRSANGPAIRPAARRPNPCLNN